MKGYIMKKLPLGLLILLLLSLIEYGSTIKTVLGEDSVLPVSWKLDKDFNPAKKSEQEVISKTPESINKYTKEIENTERLFDTPQSYADCWYVNFVVVPQILSVPIPPTPLMSDVSPSRFYPVSPPPTFTPPPPIPKQ